MRPIDKIIIHCSDSPRHLDFGMLNINDWHRERGFKASSNGLYCGYHYVIKFDGTIEHGRLESDIGAHCKGHNYSSIGICLIGDGDYPAKQMQSLFKLIEDIMNRYGLDVKHVFGHCEFNPTKTCPNFPSMDRFRDDLELYLKGGIK